MRDLPYLVPLYGLASAFLFALSTISRTWVWSDPTRARARLVSIATSAVVYWLLVLFFLESWYWLTTAALMFAIVGIIRPAISTTLAISTSR